MRKPMHHAVEPHAFPTSETVSTIYIQSAPKPPHRRGRKSRSSSDSRIASTFSAGKRRSRSTFSAFGATRSATRLARATASVRVITATLARVGDRDHDDGRAVRREAGAHRGPGVFGIAADHGMGAVAGRDARVIERGQQRPRMLARVFGDAKVPLDGALDRQIPGIVDD